jgi:WD40 repeat protein
MFTKIILFSAAFIATAISSAVAAPPAGKGNPPPPAVDIAYMNTAGSVWGEPGLATARGLSLTPSGTVSADVTLWKESSVYFNSVTWDPDGAWMAWAQTIDKKGTRAIVTGQPGGDVRTLLKFPNGDITRRNGLDTLAWGRGCNGRSVIVFLGDQLWDYLDALYVFDPFATNPQARRLYAINHGPGGSPERGHGIAFSPQGQYLIFSEQDGEGRNRLVALPLTCLSGDSLPTAAGSPQFLFPIELPTGIDGGRAWTQGIDWSPDGRRIAAAVAPLIEWTAGMQGWDVARIAVGELTYFFQGGVEQISTSESAMHLVTSGPAEGQADYSDGLPTWGPAGPSSSCDRLAFNRNGNLMLMEAPRTGYSQADCSSPDPVVVSSKSVAGLDWK